MLVVSKDPLEFRILNTIYSTLNVDIFNYAFDELTEYLSLLDATNKFSNE